MSIPTNKYKEKLKEKFLWNLWNHPLYKGH
jgi:hypothetical protein